MSAENHEVTVADVLNTFQHLLYQYVTDDHALDQLYVYLDGIEQHMMAVDEALTTVTEQRDKLAKENNELSTENQQILQSLDGWNNPIHAGVGKMIESIEESIWEEAEVESIAIVHEQTRDELIDAFATAISDKYSTNDAYRIGSQMADLILDMPDTDYSQDVLDIFKMLAEVMDVDE